MIVLITTIALLFSSCSVNTVNNVVQNDSILNKHKVDSLKKVKTDLKNDSIEKIKGEKFHMLKEAFANLDTKKIDSLLKSGVDINYAKVIPQIFYYDYASSNDETQKHIKQIDLFLKFNGDIKFIDENGNSIWMRFYSCPFDEKGERVFEKVQDTRNDGDTWSAILKYLIKKGMPINVCNKNGETVLSLAHKCGFKEEEKILLEAGARK